MDGAFGEGGGQILRTAVAFSAIKGLPIRVTNIRSGREKPGLKAQHVSTLRVLKRVFNADLAGDVEGSGEISFTPREPDATQLSFDMRTAASITLVLQAVVPAVSLSRSRLKIQLTGGTDVPWSPTFDYMSEVLSAAYGMVGIEFSARCLRRGYYPAGGGRVDAEIGPCKMLGPMSLPDPGGPYKATVMSRAGSLPRHVAERQAKAAVSMLSRKGIETGEPSVAAEESASPGSSILVAAGSGGVMVGADAIGARGKPAEKVGEEAAGSFMDALSSGATVDSNLADMMAPLLSLASGESRLLVPEVSSHLETGLHVAQLFTKCRYSIKKLGKSSVVTVVPTEP